MRRYLAEVVGTFGLVFAGCGAIVINQLQDGAITHVGIALTFGLIVMVMIYALGEISGAHMNPAVTLGFWSARRFPVKEVAPYIIAQCLGAILACIVLKILFFEHDTLGATLPHGAWWKSFVLEFILTFLLMFVILNISTGAKEKGIMAGAAIGGMVALEAMFAGPICGASMNPARSLGPALVSGHVEYLWIYLIATTAGALFAVPVHLIIFGTDEPISDAPNPLEETS